MFNISDVMIDKEEVSMTFKVSIHLSESSDSDETTVKDEQITVIGDLDSVSAPRIAFQNWTSGRL